MIGKLVEVDDSTLAKVSASQVKFIILDMDRQGRQRWSYHILQRRQLEDLLKLMGEAE